MLNSAYYTFEVEAISKMRVGTLGHGNHAYMKQHSIMGVESLPHVGKVNPG